MKKLAIAGASLAVVVVALAGVARVPAAKYALLRTVLPWTQTLSVKPLRGPAYWISGGIGNTGFIVGDSGVVAIDTQMFLPVARKQIEDIRAITPKPVNVVVLTHSDPDHINGLPAYPRGIEVIAQENAKREIQRVVEIPSSNGFPPDPAIRDYIPTHTVASEERLVLDGIPVVLIHTGPAHTDGDLVIYLPTLRIVYAGDLLTPAIGEYPGIHLEKHGSSLGWAASMKAILALDADIYVPGHGDILSKDVLKSRLQASEERRARIEALFDQGKTLAEIKTALADQPLKGAAAQFPTFVETTFQELQADRSTNKPAGH